MGLSEKDLDYRFGVRKKFNTNSKGKSKKNGESYFLSFEGDNKLDCVLKTEVHLKQKYIFSLGFWLSLLPNDEGDFVNRFPLFFGVEVN